MSLAQARRAELVLEGEDGRGRATVTVAESGDGLPGLRGELAHAGDDEREDQVWPAGLQRADPSIRVNIDLDPRNPSTPRTPICHATAATAAPPPPPQDLGVPVGDLKT
jgi:hypothetical protein